VGDVRVDVAIPTHGEGEFLGAAVASVLGQSFADLSLTVFENGPGGEFVPAVLARFAGDERLRHVVTGGVPQHENWSKCVQAGSAPLVVLLPHDEALDVEYLARRVEALEAYPQAGFVFSGVRVLNPDGSLNELRLQPIPAGQRSREELVPVFYEENPVPTASIVVRRWAYEAVGPEFSERYRMAMDWEMWLRMVVRFPAVFLPLTDSSGYVHDDSVTSKSRGWGDMHLAMAQRADELIAEHMPDYRVPRRVRARTYGYAHLRDGFEAVEDGNTLQARRALAGALRANPLLAIDPRGFALAAGTFGGQRTRNAVARIRALEAHWRLRLRLNNARKKAAHTNRRLTQTLTRNR
jgi:hypothetical protein